MHVLDLPDRVAIIQIKAIQLFSKGITKSLKLPTYLDSKKKVLTWINYQLKEKKGKKKTNSQWVP